MRIAERSVEGRHARIHRVRERAPRASVGYLSLEMRFQHLSALACSDPQAGYAIQLPYTNISGLDWNDWTVTRLD